jgi:hypothetical protein
MTPDDRQRQLQKFNVRITGLAIPSGRKADFEKSVEGMMDMADSLGYLDPLDEGISVVFDPRV